jgi:C1A family cysteine protease
MKSIAYVLILVALISIVPMGYSEAAVATTVAIEVYLNDAKVKFDTNLGLPFIDKARRTQIPFRAVLESFGAYVEWLPNEKVAVASKGSIEVRIPVGTNYIVRNTEVIRLDTNSIIKDGRNYIPLRAVMEAFGAKVAWDNELKHLKVTYSTTAPIINKLPTVYDLRNVNKLTPVKNQLNIGACWAFATLGAIESSLLPNKIYDFSEDHISLNHGYNLTQDEGGDFQISLAYLARWSGPVYESEDPYGDRVTKTGLKAAVHVQEAIILPDKDYSAIKRYIIKYGGVQTSIHIRDIVQREFGAAYNPKTNAFYYQGNSVPNHDVVIVGWDDNYSVTNFTTQPSKKGAFICRNSYGSTFGDKGYFYVSYSDSLIGKANIVYTKIEANTNYDYIYQSDWLGWVGRIGYGKETAYFSNVYTAKTKQALSAVSFYATGMDTTYEVYVVSKYVSVDDLKNNRTLVASGYLDYAGYYTIPLKNPITVSGNYAVIVKITTPDATSPVAAEYVLGADWSNTVNLKDGKGFMSLYGNSWESTENVLEANVCLKAFTKDL